MLIEVVLSQTCRAAGFERRTLLTAATTLARMPATRQAFAEGWISWSQARAVVTAVGRVDVDGRARVDGLVAELALFELDTGWDADTLEPLDPDDTAGSSGRPSDVLSGAKNSNASDGRVGQASDCSPTAGTRPNAAATGPSHDTPTAPEPGPPRRATPSANHDHHTPDAPTTLDHASDRHHPAATRRASSSPCRSCTSNSPDRPGRRCREGTSVDCPDQMPLSVKTGFAA